MPETALSEKKTIFLDYQSTTPTDPRVVQAMLPYFTENFGNPHSSEHRFGWDASAVIDKMRKVIGKPIAAQASEIIFTSGATESNNLAIKGLAQAKQRAGLSGRILVLETEHKCVIESAKDAANNFNHIFEIIPVKPNGLVDLAYLESRFDEDVILFAAMAVNNEIGVVQPLQEIGQICRKYDSHFHCDAAQGYGKIPLNVLRMEIDSMSISGHKIYGPMGIGALYLRKKKRKADIIGQMSGGGQEKGLRSGTLPTPLIVGLGKAAEIMAEEGEAEARRLFGLRSLFLDQVQKDLNSIAINGDMTHRIGGNINITFDAVDQDALLGKIPHIAASGGSACSSSKGGGSHVLRALGHDPSRNDASLRFGFGRFTTEEEVTQAANDLVDAIRAIAP